MDRPFLSSSFTFAQSCTLYTPFLLAPILSTAGSLKPNGVLASVQISTGDMCTVFNRRRQCSSGGKPGSVSLFKADHIRMGGEKHGVSVYNLICSTSYDLICRSVYELMCRSEEQEDV